jgi:UDP-glucose 4-epimerase
MPTPPSKAVVSGGAGFIGSHLVDGLLARGIDVTVVDDLRTGRESNLAHVRDRVDLVIADVSKDSLEGTVSEGDWVFHLAGMADIVPSIEAPRAYFESNVIGTFNVLEEARRAGAGRFVYTASSTCYGLPEVFPTPEEASIDCRYPYAETKYAGEHLAMHWASCYGLPVVSLRLFNVYGPRSRTTGAYGAVFGVFLAQKLANEPFTVVGDGEQTRDFTYVTDVVEGMIRAAESGVRGEAINIASGKPQSINRLIELLEGDVTNIPKRPGEPDCTWADITKADRMLGWQPTIAFEDGVARMRERIDDWRDAPVWTPESIEDATATWFAQLGS